MDQRTLFVAITVAATLSLPLGAQERGARPAGEARVQSQTQAQAQAATPQARIDAAMRSAAEARIPTSLLASKVAEGEAKRVPPERIAAAVEARLAALVRASGTINRAQIESSSAAELAVTADALEAGASESAVVRIYRNAPAERRVVAVAVLADLVRLGHGSEPSFARVNAALGSSASLANLQAEVASQLRLGGISSTLEANGVVRIP